MNRASLGAVLAGFVLLSLACLGVSGVRVGGDTPIYVDGARAVLDGRALMGRQPSYLGYVWIVALCEMLGLGLKGVVILQIVTATVAMAIVYRAAAELAGRAAGIVASSLLAIDVDTNRWHLFILSDSMYTSLLVITAWLIHGSARRPASLRRLVAGAVALVALAFVRPEGWFVIPAAAIYWVIGATASSSRRRLGVAAVTAGCTVLVLAVAPALVGNVEAVGPGEMLRQGQTIWDYDGWRLRMPEASLSATGGGAGSAISYALAHPMSTLTLMAARVGVHLAHVRPFYSVGHNALIVAWLVPIYFFGGYALWRLRANSWARWSASLIAVQAVVVALTHAEWEGRYLTHVLPLWYPLAAAGIVMAYRATARPRVA